MCPVLVVLAGVLAVVGMWWDELASLTSTPLNHVMGCSAVAVIIFSVPGLSRTRQLCTCLFNDPAN